jgi:acetyl-CoA acetyltransferase family protein
MNFRPKDFNGKNVAIVSGVRTPFAKAGTDLANLSSVDLGVFAMQEAIAQAGIRPDEVDHVVVGNVAQPADAANVGRVIALYAGVPKDVPGFTVQRNCASGMESISQACTQIATGQADVVIAGGTENMTQIPLLFSEELKGIFFGVALGKTLGRKLGSLSKMKMKYLKPIIGIESGLRDPVSGLNMGETAERLVRDFGISRQEQDEFALKSHQKAIAGRERLKEEITPAYIPPKYKKIVDVDKGPRENQTIEQLAKLRPYFDRKHGTVTVGNACPVTDGAAMMVLMSEEKARAEGREILGIIRGIEFSGCEPSRMGLGPAFAGPAVLNAVGKEMKDMDLVEINEAFAAQVLACVKAFGSKDFAQKQLGRSDAVGELDPEKLNVNGGAIALGHPVGTSGTRLVLTILKELKRRNQQTGLATLCIGGGQGGACIVERAA